MLSHGREPNELKSALDALALDPADARFAFAGHQGPISFPVVHFHLALFVLEATNDVSTRSIEQVAHNNDQLAVPGYGTRKRQGILSQRRRRTAGSQNQAQSRRKYSRPRGPHPIASPTPERPRVYRKNQAQISNWTPKAGAF